MHESTTSQPEPHVGEEVRAAASDVGKRAAQELESRKGSIAGQVSALANALHSTADQLESQQQAGIARYAHEAADVVERFGSSIENKNLSDILRDVERVVRDHPAAVLGVSAFVGFLGTRFLRTSERTAERRASEWRETGEEWKAEGESETSVRQDLIVPVSEDPYAVRPEAEPQLPIEQSSTTGSSGPREGGI